MEQPFKSKAIYATQLGVIAALVDGQASQVEMDTLTAKISEWFKVNPDEVTRLASNMVNFYQNCQIGTNPGVALHFAAKSLDNMSAFDRKMAFTIAEQVIDSDGTDAMEKGFLAQLKSFARV